MITRVESCNINSRYTPNFKGLRQVPVKPDKIKEPVLQYAQRSGVFQTVKDIVGEMFPVFDKRYRDMVKSSPKKAAKMEALYSKFQ